MTQLQNRIGSLGASPKPKLHFRFGRWIVTVLYLLAVGIQLVALGVSPDLRSFGVLALTATYAILMLLLWLHERFPPQSS